MGGTVSGMVQVNTDGASLGNPGAAGAAGIAIDQGLMPLWIETDSTACISLISTETSHWALQRCLMCIRLRLRDATWRISHIYREGNRVADALATLAVSLLIERILLPSDIPLSIRGLLRADADGLSTFHFS
ncbi:uncharacterized protein LOC127260416 [Andrographis paniculata]|uniref:uncharacterized protein LOC127260416 n=1 Tax=Andrographis paniculata TaxID=175694 RepID=UPI0021E79584|nr:uncharacterized protein LOC127260416 [Andrographis paniculata]